MSPAPARPLLRSPLVLSIVVVLAGFLLPAAPAGAAFGYLGEWGTSGSGDGQFLGAAGIDTDAAGNVYVADCNADRVQKFTANGAFITKWGTRGSANGQFVCARDVAVDATGVYVVDAGNNRVQKFTTAGVYVSKFNAVDSVPSRVFDQPNSVATDGTNVYVADTSSTDLAGLNKQRIQRFNTSGAWQALVGGPGSGVGQYGKPAGVAVGATGVYVTDQDANRVVRFTPTWTAGEVWGTYGTGNGQFREFHQGLDVDATGSVWVADMNNNRIQKFSSTGAFLGTWGTEGAAPDQFNRPMDVAAGPSSTLYIADKENARVVKYGEGATTLPTVVTGDATLVTWKDATLNGTVNPKGTATSYQFEYGTTTAYGTTTTAIAAGAGSADVAAITAIAGLAADTTYHVRIVALRGASVVATGADKTFKTAPNPGTAPGCNRVGHTVGVVGICADAMTYDAGRWTATGNVVLNGGVSVSGPVVANDGLVDITSAASVIVEVMRGPPVRIGTGTLHIEAAGVTDPVSGHTALGKMTISNLLSHTLASVPFVPLVTNYIDAASGGGVVMAGRPSFDLLGPLAGLALPTGSFSLGIHKDAPGPFKVLGGSIRWDGVQLGSNWKLGTFSVGYAEGPPSTWFVMGAFEFPYLSSSAGVEISGAFSGGSLDAIGLKLKTPGVPLGTTGIILDTFGGSLKGLSGGANNPLIITALVGGGWLKTNAPDPFGWVLHLKEVSLSVNTAGSGTLAGEIDVLDGEGRLVKGTASLTLQLAPTFLASGTLNASWNALAVSAALTTSAVIDRYHFTAQGSVSGQVLGKSVANGSGVISDKGVGATTRICIPWVGCLYVGAGMKWANVTTIPPKVDWIGSNINQYVTLTASAASATARAGTSSTRQFSVKPKQPLLYIEARGDEAPAFELVSPTGVRYRPGRSRKDLFTQTIGDVTALVVYAPKAGRWKLRSLAGEQTRYSIETIPEIGRVRPGRITPATTQKKPLSAKTKKVRLSWSGQDLPGDTRLTLYVANSKNAPGKVVRSGLRVRGTTTVDRKLLSAGANYFSLVPSSGGVRFDLVRFPKPVWKR